MTITRPIGKNSRIALFMKESTEGVYVDPTQAHHFVSEGMKYAPASIEDPSNIGKVLTTDLIKTGYSVEGSVESKGYPYFIGDALFFTLGDSDSPANPVQGFLIIWYTGSSMYARLTKSGSTITAEISSNGSSWSADTNFDSEGSLPLGSMTLSQIASAIDAFTDYKATYFGYSSSPNTNLEDFTATVVQAAGVSIGALIAKCLVSTSTIAKTHSIYVNDDATKDIPSFSMCIDRNFGAGRDFGFAGCKIQSLAISAEPKNLIGMSINIKAKEQISSETFAGSAIPSDAKAYTTNMTKILVDKLVSQEVKNLSLTFNNNLAMDEAVGLETFSSQMRQGASIDVSGTMNLTVTDASDEETAGVISKMQADTPVEVIMYMEGSTYADITNHIKHSVLIRLRAVKLSECSPVVSGAERLTLPLTGKCVSSAYGRHADVIVTNNKLTAY